ncbi:MAG TPA: bifunctional (p)ppGpp synthetase/guanosine-3',5'-bis(diphosphate) 3'-pyrophosphohydrolase [Dehalococcoidia bacterium]|nr:bifunctional (p)ppGpp synthetase/guanosine-3',5'-bis(diphosphate) 3'-pyrophosphohydrolase [Dehalococcoidia bacterium]
MVATPIPTADEILMRAGEGIPADRARLVREAYEFAWRCHDGQLRDSGDPYIVHPIDAAMTVASLNLDAATIMAALLHDVVEDCGVPSEEISKKFGADVAQLVEGVTKLSRLSLVRPDESSWDDHSQADNLRKMFLAMAEDLRVVVVKLADRLHNMRTLHALPREKQLRIARETSDIYAPLAHRLGLGAIASELDDLAFRYLEPLRYEEIARLLAASQESRERYVSQVEKILRYELQRQGVQAELSGRAKNIFSIYQKMQKYAEMGKSFNDIYDLIAIRVLVNSVADCYHALGVVHGLWRPLPGLFDDYIANPREGVYQSLHTTVMGPGARPLEVQIRTYEMHRTAEYGVAAHWRYKEGGRQDRHMEERIAWLRQLLEWQRETAEAEEFVEFVKTELFKEEVFVFSPKGEIKDLPAGSTPIDFAFRIHTDIGFHCVGAKVNGRLVPLTYKLQNGDVVEIITSRTSRGPSRDWLNPNLGYVKTGNARSKIRQWLKRQEREENILRGREMVDRELRRLGVTTSDLLPEMLKWFKFESADDFFASVGYGGVSLSQITGRTALHLKKDEPEEVVTPVVTPRPPSYGSDIKVLGTGDLLTQIARCCHPVPGDSIIGYVTRARGVTIHRDDCHNVVNASEPERLIGVEWGRTTQLFPVSVRIEAWDRVGLLRDLSTIAAEEKVNMTGVRTHEHPDHTTTLSITLETTGVEQLSRLLAKMEGVRGVFAVSRVLDQASAGRQAS